MDSALGPVQFAHDNVIASKIISFLCSKQTITWKCSESLRDHPENNTRFDICFALSYFQ